MLSFAPITRRGCFYDLRPAVLSGGGAQSVSHRSADVDPDGGPAAAAGIPHAARFIAAVPPPVRPAGVGPGPVDAGAHPFHPPSHSDLMGSVTACYAPPGIRVLSTLSLRFRLAKRPRRFRFPSSLDASIPRMRTSAHRKGPRHCRAARLRCHTGYKTEHKRAPLAFGERGAFQGLQDAVCRRTAWEFPVPPIYVCLLALRGGRVFLGSVIPCFPFVTPLWR